MKDLEEVITLEHGKTLADSKGDIIRGKSFFTQLLIVLQ
jgi:hypothetical protein